MRKMKRQPRRKLLPFGKFRPRPRVVLVTLMLAVLGADMVVLHRAGHLRTAGLAIDAGAQWALREAGLSVRSITVSGREQTGREEFMRALGVKRGAPILSVDLAAAQARIAALPWVREVRLARVLPDTLHAELIERIPVAIWQRNRALVLVDGDGVVITASDVPEFRHLPLIVGNGAPKAVASLIAMLEAEPRLQARVAAAIRVGERRWNIRLEGGIDVRLPEIDAPGAWRKLAQYEQDNGLLGRDVEFVDLRLPDQVVVRLTQGAVKRALTPELHTQNDSSHKNLAGNHASGA